MDHFNQYKDKANEELQEAYKLLEVLKGGLTGGARRYHQFVFNNNVPKL